MSRSAVEGGHSPCANRMRYQKLRTERQLARKYCHHPEDADGCDIPEARRMKHRLWADDFHNHRWHHVVNMFICSHINYPAADVLRKIEHWFPSSDYRHRMLRKEVRYYIERATEYTYWYDFMVDAEGIIREPELAPWLR